MLEAALAVPTPAPNPLNSVVIDYASLAIIATILTRFTTAVWRAFRRVELSGEAKRFVAAGVSLIVTLAYLKNSLINADWNSAPQTAALFALVVTVAGNLYDKVLQPIEKTARKSADANRAAQTEDDANRAANDAGQIGEDWRNAWREISDGQKQNEQRNDQQNEQRNDGAPNGNEKETFGGEI